MPVPVLFHVPRSHPSAIGEGPCVRRDRNPAYRFFSPCLDMRQNRGFHARPMEVPSLTVTATPRSKKNAGVRRHFSQTALLLLLLAVIPISGESGGTNRA